MGAVGFAANVMFLALGAPDVAMVQAVVEIVVLVVLIRATVGRDVETTSGVRETFGLAAAIVLLSIFAVFAVLSVASGPDPLELGRTGMMANRESPSRTTYLPEALEETGAPSAVAAVLLDYRAYDTLGEATVLFASLIGAIVLLRRRARRLTDKRP
jgi:multisubunit Na+/H+ antiporter MnhB subunit